MSSQFQNGLYLREAFELISNTTISGVLYGTVFALYCLCTRLSCIQLREPDKRRQARFTLVYTSLIMLCTTTSLALTTRTIQLAFLNHVNSPVGPLGYQSPMTTAIGVIDFVICVLTMVIQIWRLWVVWSGTQYAVAVTVLPLLLLCAYIGLNICINIGTGFLTHMRLGISPGRLSEIVTVIYSVLSTFTILVTGLVTARLLLVRRRQIRIMGTSGTSGPYMSIVAILVESYALDSMWSTGAAISTGMRGPSMFLLVENDFIIKVIAYLLVIYRVAAGRGWTKETEHKLTSLQWNRGAHTTADEASCIQSRAPATPTVVVIGCPPISCPVSVV